MADGTAALSYMHKYQPPPPSVARKRFGGLDPEGLTSILNDLERGNFERWADLASWMVRTDPHLRSLVRTRIDGVARSPIVITPNPDDEPQLALDAADVVTAWQQQYSDWPDRFADLLWGGQVGIAVQELVWKPRQAHVDVCLEPVDTRDLRYRRTWRLEARTYTDSGSSEWIQLDRWPDKFLIHQPRMIPDRPTLTGELLACAWPWLFKRWIEKLGLEGFGRLANGLLYSLIPRNTEKAVRDQRLADLESMAADGIAVFDHDPTIAEPIRLLEAAKDPGASTETLLKHYNGELSKALLGSGLNVEVQDSGGNRALGESQFDTTTLPRLEADAARALGSIERQVIAPYLRMNRHLFGGRIPKPPIMTAQIVDDAGQVDELVIAAGAATIDELRQSRGLEPWGSEKGGDKPIPVTPQVSGGAPADSPFARPIRRRKRKRYPTTASRQMSFPIPSPLAHALSRKSDG